MIQLEYQNFMDTLWKLAKLKRQDATKALNEAGKTFTRYAMRFTPPFPARGRDSMALEGAMGNHYAKGKEVVARDIRRVFTPLEEAGIIKSPRNNELAQRINFLAFGKRPAAMPVTKYKAGTLESRVSLSSLLKPSKKLEPRLNKLEAIYSLQERMDALNAIGDNLGWPKIVEEARRYEHQAARGKRGRVSARIPISHRRIVIDRKSIDFYVEQTWRHLGQAKAGWRLAAMALGVSPRDFQGWISRHNTASTWINNNFPNQSKKSITIGNRVRWRYDFEIQRILSSAINQARITMEKQIQVIARKQKEAWERRKSARTVQGGLRVGRFGGPSISVSPRIFTGGR